MRSAFISTLLGSSLLAGSLFLAQAAQAESANLATVDMMRAFSEVDEGRDGLKALEFLSSNSVDAILMDVQMPGMDGFQTTAEIRKDKKYGEKIPIIALTAHAMKEDRDRCLQEGMDDYLSKPFSEEALREVLKRHLPSSRPT